MTRKERLKTQATDFFKLLTQSSSGASREIEIIIKEQGMNYYFLSLFLHQTENNNKDEDYVSKALVFLLFFMCHRIGEYIF